MNAGKKSYAFILRILYRNTQIAKKKYKQKSHAMHGGKQMPKNKLNLRIRRRISKILLLCLNLNPELSCSGISAQYTWIQIQRYIDA